MYGWVVFLHVIGVFGFLMAHGVSAGVSFRLRKERNREHIRLLLDLSASTAAVFGVSFLLLFITGIIGGFMGNWWSKLWIWVALGLLIAISVVMSALGQRYYHRLRKAVGLPYMEAMKQHPPSEPASDEEIAAIAASGRPMLLAVIGFGGIIIITWLMKFKPF